MQQGLPDNVSKRRNHNYGALSLAIVCIEVEATTAIGIKRLRRTSGDAYAMVYGALEGFVPMSKQRHLTPSPRPGMSKALLDLLAGIGNAHALPPAEQGLRITG